MPAPVENVKFVAKKTAPPVLACGIPVPVVTDLLRTPVVYDPLPFLVVSKLNWLTTGDLLLPLPVSLPFLLVRVTVFD